MARVTVQTSWPLRGVQRLMRDIITLAANLNSMFTELYADLVITVPVDLHISKLTYSVFVARRGYTVSSIDYVPDIAQGAALTATVVKATGTATPASATTPMHIAAAINLNGTAHTVQPITLTVTAANLVLAAGDRIGLVLSGAMTAGSGAVVIRMTRTGT